MTLTKASNINNKIVFVVLFMPFAGLVVKDGSYKVSVFKDKDPKQIPNGYCIVKQSFFGITHSDVNIKNGALGMEGSGIIEFVAGGESKRGFVSGDKVCYYLKTPVASYENVIVHESNLIKVPSGVSMELAACARKFLTAHYMLQKIFTLRPGFWIMITGATGALGTILTAWANHLGLNVVAIVSTDEKKQVALQNGAKLAINYKKENIEEQVAKVTNNYYAFVIYDMIGKDLYKRLLKSSSFFGNYILIEPMTGFPEVSFNDMLTRSTSIRYPSMDHYKATAFENVIGGVEFFDFCTNKNFSPTVHKFPISKFSNAIECLKDQSRTGLVVCNFN